MSKVHIFADGGYRYIAGVAQYSAGVAAEPGYEVVRARFTKPAPLREGFAAAESHLNQLGRPLSAFCACELRSPAPFSESGFVAFNRSYIDQLAAWGIVRNDVNPVARTNVCPVVDAPNEPSMFAFSYTMPIEGSAPSFVIAGSGEAREGGATYRESIVRYGDVSREAMREKVRFVLAAMSDRLAALGLNWADVQSSQVYTVHDIGALVWEELEKRGAGIGPMEWHLSRPPVEAIEYEMDLRSPSRSHILVP